MALHHFLCGLTVVILLSSKGCHSQSKCGLAPRNTRIAGGEDASPGSWPWQVSVNIIGFGFICGGSLITDQWVMTAASCINSLQHDDLTVHLGQHSQSGPNSHEVTRGVEQVTCHPPISSLINDICLLKLSAPVTLTDYIFPVCLASENSTFHTGFSTWATGWGVNENFTPLNILQEVNLRVIGNNECRCIYDNFITEDMICAGVRAGVKGPCFRDTGGALVAKNGSSWFQIGVMSFVSGCGDPNFPTVLTRVSQYQDWINNITGSSQPGYVTFMSSGVDSDVNFTCPTAPPKTTAKLKTATTANTTANTTTTTTANTTTTVTTTTTTTANTTADTTTTTTANTTTTTTTANTTTTTTANTTTTVTTTTANTTINGARLPPCSCPDACRDGDSVFDGGENLIHFSQSTHFISLCVLVLSLFVLLGDA